jgi:hypothetical protein
MPGLPKELVRWREDPQCQPGPNHPSIVLSTVSLVENGPISLELIKLPDNISIRRELSQRWFWRVQVRVESWRNDISTDVNPWRFAQRMRFGWRTLAVQTVLDDDFPTGRHYTARHPLKVVDDPTEIRDVSAPVGGHRLPQYIYELEFSYVDYDVDEQTDAVLDGATVAGDIALAPEDDGSATDDPDQAVVLDF